MSRLVLSACGLFASLLLAAPPKERPPLRIDVNSVLVDVIVTDKNNRHVTDLKPEDFEILEDSQPQELDTFEVIAGRHVRPSTGPAPTIAEQGMPYEASAPPRLIVLLLDYATVEYLNQGYVRDAAVRYVKENMVPGDLIAVFQVGMTLKFLQQFTDNREQIIQALKGSEVTGSSYALDQETLSENAQTSQDRAEFLSASIDAVLTSPGAPQGQKLAMVEILNQYMLMAQRLEARYYAQLSFSRQQQSRPIIGAIETIARGVQHLEGRKTLIMFSQGFSVPLALERAFYRCIHVANRSNLAVYAIDAGGLQFKQPRTEQELFDVSAARPGDRKLAYAGISQFDRAREIGTDQRDSTLRYLTTSTGGFLVRHTNDFLSALKRIDADARSYYLLSYRPRVLRLDGEFRTIKVEVKRPGLQVRARPGYWALPAGASLLSPEEYKRLIRPAWSLSSDAADSRSLTLSSHCSHFLDAGGRYSVHLLADLPLKDLVIHQSEGRAFLEVEAIGIVRDEQGQVVTSFRGPSRISTNPAHAAEAQRARFGATLVLAPGKYSITFVVTDPANQKTAREERSLLLPAPSQSLAVSSVCLSREATRVPTGATGPFTLGGSEIIISADRLFGRHDPLICFFRIYRPGLMANQDPNVECDVSLILGGKVVSRNEIPVEGRTVDLTPVPNLPVARYFSLEGLPPGTYIVRVQAHDRAHRESASAQASFTLLPADGKITD